MYRVLNINHKQELLRGLWVTFRTQKRFKGTLLHYQYQASSCLNHSRATAKLASISAKTLAANAEPSMRFRWMSSYLHRGTFRQLGVPYFGGPDNKDPIIKGTRLGSSIFGSPHISPSLNRQAL